MPGLASTVALLAALLLQEPRQVLAVAGAGGFVGNGTVAAWDGWALAGLGGRAREAAATPEGAERPVAVAYRREGAAWTRHQVLAARVPDSAGVRFVACDGDAAVVGLRSAVLVFERADGTWSLARALGPEDGVDPRPVWSADVEDGVIVLGRGDEPELFGSALVLERGPQGWARTALLGGDDAWFGFGMSVATARGTIAVGVPGHPRALQEAGSVHLYERGAAGWTRAQVLRGPGSSPTVGAETSRDAFGDSLALRGDLLVVGAADDAFVHRRGAGAWELDGALRSVDGDATGGALADGIGPWTVATDGRRVAVRIDPLGVPPGGAWRIRIFARPATDDIWTPGPFHEDLTSRARAAFVLPGPDLLVASAGGWTDGEPRASALAVLPAE